MRDSTRICSQLYLKIVSSELCSTLNVILSNVLWPSILKLVNTFPSSQKNSCLSNYRGKWRIKVGRSRWTVWYSLEVVFSIVLLAKEGFSFNSVAIVILKHCWHIRFQIRKKIMIEKSAIVSFPGIHDRIHLFVLPTSALMRPHFWWRGNCVGILFPGTTQKQWIFGHILYIQLGVGRDVISILKFSWCKNFSCKVTHMLRERRLLVFSFNHFETRNPRSTLIFFEDGKAPSCY